MGDEEEEESERWDLGRDVVDDDDAVGAAVVGARNRPEPLLA